MLGTFGANSAAWTHAVLLFTAGLLDLAPLVTHRYALTEYQTVFDTLIAKQQGTLKVLVTQRTSAPSLARDAKRRRTRG
ncbi:MAG: hypothetical protein WKH64_07520 [Chloroflexia bacterium]